MLDRSLCPAVERDPQRLGGIWVFRGTRIPVSALFENLEDSAQISQFLEWLPRVNLSPDQNSPFPVGRGWMIELQLGELIMKKKLDITNNQRIVYSINVEDLQNVANDELLRDLNADEIKTIEDRLGDYIPWYDAIILAIGDVINDKNEEEP